MRWPESCWLQNGADEKPESSLLHGAWLPLGPELGATVTDSHQCYFIAFQTSMAFLLRAFGIIVYCVICHCYITSPSLLIMHKLLRPMMMPCPSLHPRNQHEPWITEDVTWMFTQSHQEKGVHQTNKADYKNRNYLAWTFWKLTITQASHQQTTNTFCYRI